MESQQKNELIGVVQAGGFSSKYGFLNHLIEETKLEFTTSKFYFYFNDFFNAVIKHYLKNFHKSVYEF